MKPTFVITALLVLLVGATLGCKPVSDIKKIGLVKFVKGEAQLESNGKKQPLKVGDVFNENDVISTGPGAAAVAVLGNSAEVEIQENAMFRIAEFNPQKKTLILDQGNLWLRVNKRGKHEDIILNSPTAVASIRGTKFFTFKIGDIHGTCVCQGKVALDIKGQAYHKAHDQDYLIVTRAGKTAVISSDELKFMGEPGKGHHHSVLDNSPLGKKPVLTEAQQKMFMETLLKKLKEAK